MLKAKNITNFARKQEKMSNSIVTKIACIIFTVIGIALLWFAKYNYQTTAEFQQNSVVVKGSVIYLSESHSKGRALYKPVVEYAYNNQTFQIKGSVASRPPAYEVGENVDILLKIDNPQEAMIDSFFEKWFLVVVFAALGIIFTFFSMFMLFLSW